jgi:hypothetical protein
MSVFKKRCFLCGKQTNRLYDQHCEECFSQEFPPIKEVKPISLKVDNITQDICYNNHYYPQKEFFKMLPEIMKKNIVLNQGYVLKEYSLENIEVKGHKLLFDIHVDCDLEK